MSRPRRWDHFLEIAAVVAKRSTCPRLAVGAVIVSPDYNIISTGYNGAPRNAPHCTEAKCVLNLDDHCVRAVHAEANAIVHAACCGAATKGAYMFCTHQPCRSCLHLIINAGIKSVIYKHAYKDDDGTNFELSRLAQVSISQWKGSSV